MAEGIAKYERTLPYILNRKPIFDNRVQCFNVGFLVSRISDLTKPPINREYLAKKVFILKGGMNLFDAMLGAYSFLNEKGESREDLRRGLALLLRAHEPLTPQITSEQRRADINDIKESLGYIYDDPLNVSQEHLDKVHTIFKLYSDMLFNDLEELC